MKDINECRERLRGIFNITVTPFTASGAREAGLDACPLSPPIVVTLYALTLKGSEPSPALNALLEIVTEKAENLLTSTLP